MPIKQVTDPVTGKVTEVFEFGPAKAATKAKPAKPAGPEPIAAALGDAMAQGPAFRAAGAGLQTLQKTGDFGKAFGAGTQSIVNDINKGTGAIGAIKRAGFRGVLTSAQETSDFVQEAAAKLQGKPSPTSFKKPDAPFLGVLPAIPRARSSGPVEDLLVGAVQIGLGYVTGSAAAGLGGMAVKGAFGALPQAARLGVATTRLRAAKGFAEAVAPVAQVATKIGTAIKAAPGGQTVLGATQAVGKSVAGQVIGKGAITAGATDLVAFDQYGGRATDAVYELVKGTPFEPLALEYFRTNPNDVGLDGRFKNAIEGISIGGAIELPFRLFKAIKSFQNYKTIADASKQLDKLKDPKVVEALDDAKNANDAFQNEVVKQAETRPEEPGQQPDLTDELERPIARNVAEVDPTTLAIAPDVYQYKIAGAKTKTGVSGSLKESKEYNAELAGIISVYLNPKDGKTYVVNGHNRVQKALESGTAKVLVRYIQANSPEGARAIGALQNIAEGQGTAIDAAKFMRDMKTGPESLQNYGVNLTGKIATRAIPLARLPQNVFDQVSTGALTEDRAIALGSVKDLDETIINSVAARAEKGKWSADKITQAMQEAKFATASTPAAGGGMLPGFEDFFATSNFDQLLDVRTEAAKALREGVVALSSAARAGRQGVLEAAGNVIDVAGSQAAKATAQQAVNLFDRVTQYEGPVRALLNDLAAQITPKKKAAQVVKENLERIRAAIDDEANGPRLPFEEPTPEAPRPQPVPVEPELPPTAEESSVVAPEAPQPQGVPIEDIAPRQIVTIDSIVLPDSAFRKLTPEKEISAAEGYRVFHNAGLTVDNKIDTPQALEVVRAKGQRFNADGIPGLDIDQALRDMGVGRYTPEVAKVRNAYMEAYSNQPMTQLAPTPTTPADPVSLSEQLAKEPTAPVETPKLIATPVSVPAAKEMPDTRGQGRFFHGTATKIDELRGGYSSLQNVYGDGFYTTEDFQTANSYTKKNVRGAKETGKELSKTVYEIAEKEPVKFYDLNAPISPIVREFYEQLVEFPYVTDAAQSTWDDLGNNPNVTLAQIMDETRERSGRESSASEIGIEWSELEQKLIDEGGFGGYTHVGGILTKSKRQHQVRIYWEESFKKLNLAETSAEKIVDNVIAAVAAPKAGTPDEIRLAAAEEAGNTELAEQLRARIAANPLRSRGPELPELPKGAKKPPLTREEIEARLADINELITRIEKGELDMTVDEPATRALVGELTKDIRTVAGDKAAIRFNNAFIETEGGDVAWGYKPGETMKIGGEYDPIQDIIEVNGVELVSADVQRPELLRLLLDNLEKTGFHEAFHRIQFNFLKPEELRVFNQYLAEIKLDLGSMKEREINAREGREDLFPIEKAAVSFQIYAWARKNNLDPRKALLGYTREELGQKGIVPALESAALAVMDTLFDFVERVGNAFNKRGFISVKSIFEDAYSGKLAKRGELGSVVDEAGKAVNPNQLERFDLLQGMSMEYGDTRRGSLNLPPLRSNADSFVNEYEKVKAKIASGEMTIEDLITNAVADRNVQPMVSPSGKTAYVPDPEAAQGAAASMRAMMNALGTREQVTGQPAIPDELVQKAAADWIAKNDYQSKVIMAELARRSSSLENNAENLRALHAAQLVIDYANHKAGIIADKWINSKANPDVDRNVLRQELLASYKDVTDKNTAYIKVTRPLGQLLRATQIPRVQPGDIKFKDTINDPNLGELPINAIKEEDAIPLPDQPADIKIVTTIDDYNLGELLENAAKEEDAISLPDHLGEKIDPEFVDAINNDEFTPELDAMIDQIAYNLKAARDTPGFATGFWGNLNKASKIGLNGLVMYRSAQILSSGITFWSNTMNGILKAFQLPLSQALGATINGSPERVNMSLMIYGQYYFNLKNAFSLAKESYIAGRTLYDIDSNSLDFLDQQVRQEPASSASPGMEPYVDPPTTDKGFTLSTLPWVEIQDKSNWAIAQKRMWQLATSPIRAQVAVDTLFKTLVGQSFEFVRNLPMGLDSAVAKGLDRNSQAAWDYAEKYAKAAVDRATRHVTLEDRTILDAVMEGPHAQTAMRWATFTDDIDAQMEIRTLDRGRELAADKKLEGEAAESWAKEWASKKVEMPWFYKGPSFVPMVWQHLINMSPFFSILQPFNRTPGDIIKSAMRMTPGANFLVDTYQRDINSMDAFTRDRAAGDVALGASAMVLASIAMTTGIVEFCGGGPQEPGAKQKWRDMGNQAYSFRVGDGEWTSMRAFESFATMFGAIADYNEIANKVTKEQKEQLGSSLVLYIMGEVYKGNLSKSYYQGFTEFYEAVSGNTGLGIAPNSRDSWNRYISRIVASLEPASSALRSGRRISDRAVRQVEPSNIFQETFDEIRNQTPGWSKDIPARVNWLTGDMIIQSRIMGDEYLPADSPWMGMIMQYMPQSAFQIGQEKRLLDPVALEMSRLHGLGTEFRGPSPTDYGTQLRLGPRDFAEYNRVMATVTNPVTNTTLYQELDATIKSDYYQSLPLQEISSADLSDRALIIDEIVTRYKEIAKTTYLGQRPDLEYQLLKKEAKDNTAKYRLKYGLPQFIEAFR